MLIDMDDTILSAHGHRDRLEHRRTEFAGELGQFSRDRRRPIADTDANSGSGGRNGG